MYWALVADVSVLRGESGASSQGLGKVDLLPFLSSAESKAHAWRQKEALSRTKPARTLELGLAILQNCEAFIFINHPVLGTLLQPSEHTKTRCKFVYKLQSLTLVPKSYTKMWISSPSMLNYPTHLLKTSSAVGFLSFADMSTHMSVVFVLPIFTISCILFCTLSIHQESMLELILHLKRGQSSNLKTLWLWSVKDRWLIHNICMTK